MKEREEVEAVNDDDWLLRVLKNYSSLVARSLIYAGASYHITLSGLWKMERRRVGK